MWAQPTNYSNVCCIQITHSSYSREPGLFTQHLEDYINVAYTSVLCKALRWRVGLALTLGTELHKYF